MSPTTTSFRRFKQTRDSLYVVLNTLARVAEERGETTVIETDQIKLETKKELSRCQLADILRQRAENVRKKQVFRLAVVGEFNVGKSSLINALLGREILSVARQPTTAAITTLRYGEPERFRVTYLPEYQKQFPTILRESQDLFNDIASYTSDPAHTGDRGVAIMEGEEVSLAEKIKEVEVWCNANFLRDQEIEIIDTPGLGSVFEAHKTVTYSLIPEVDATLFLFSTDGIDTADISFLKFLREYVNQMLFVMTKADYVEDKRVLEDTLHFNREVIISSITNVDIQQIYPVSARNVLNGQYEESGLPEFIRALQYFLVKSSGTARLQVSLQVARFNWALLQEGVERDLELANKSLSDIQKVRQKLEQERELIIQRKQALKKYITDTIEEMLYDAIFGIDVLSTQIQIIVETQIDSYSLKDLLKVNQYVPSVIKEKIDAWISEKEERFKSKSQLLQQRIEEDLRTILKSIQNTIPSSRRKKRADIVTPQIKGVFTQGVLQFTKSTVFNTGASFATGLTWSTILWGIAISPLISIAPATTLIAPPFIVLIPLLFAARRMAEDTVSFKKKLGDNIKNAMRNSIPHNSVNVYQAVVGGYIDDRGYKQPGMREIVTKSFHAWGDELKTNVEFIVSNNLDTYQQNLERRIFEEEQGQWSRGETLKTFNLQNKDLLDSEKQLIELETIIKQLSSNDFIYNEEKHI